MLAPTRETEENGKKPSTPSASALPKTHLHEDLRLHAKDVPLDD